jgi:MYXO-CTERM domain-containing protein
MRLPQPLYESLPALYALGGVGALVLGYRLHAGPWSVVCTAGGLLAIVLGAAVAMRRRDFRDHQREYAARGSMPPGEKRPD